MASTAIDSEELVVPLIDMGPLRDGSADGVEKVARDVAAACTSSGFLYVVNHGVSKETVDGIFQANKDFHALPLEKKLELQINQFYRGYVPFAGSTLKVSSIGEAKKPNQSEQIIFRHELAADDPDLGQGLPLQGPNQWPSPDDLPDFKDTVLTYMSECERVARLLFPVFAHALNLPQDHFDQFFVKPVKNLKLLHYPAQPKDRPADQFGAAPHTDFGFVTVLAQDDTGGLEVRSPDGSWHPAPVIPDSFVINIGDALSRWTNGRFASTPHRVINRAPHRSRYSVPFFLDPNMHSVIEALPGTVTEDQPAAHEPVKYSDYLMTRLGSNFPIVHK
ncbi:MAG: 2-oxoglutarate and iron-dependent oxygenase domain-containing protein [Marinovum algicola]|uniref:isopenicillin N synthase family dioxygenase n=1 Tax=Roseobacteraceae TaxID=2854170 RepID=UPI0032EB5F9D